MGCRESFVAETINSGDAYCIPLLGLLKEVKGADAQVRDLRRTVEYVENNRDSFTHIDDVSRDQLLALLAS